MKNIYLPTRLERFHAYVSVLLRGEQSRYDAFFSGAQFPAGNLVRLTDEDTSRKPVTDVHAIQNKTNRSSQFKLLLLPIITMKFTAAVVVTSLSSAAAFTASS